MQIPEISVESLNELRESDAHVTLIDVREPHEYEAAHAVGAILVPLGDIIARKDELPEGPLHIICKSGGRSHTACEALASLDYEVTNIAGGTDAWVANGYAVATGSTPE